MYALAGAKQDSHSTTRQIYDHGAALFERRGVYATLSCALLPLTQMDHPAAAHRLALGVPATVEHAPIEAKALSAPASVVDAQRVAETTQNFITLMDALKLQMRAKDQLHPLLSDVLRTYAPRPSRDEHAEEDVRAKLLEWCVCLTDAGSFS